MLDAALFLTVIVMFLMGLRRPFLWVLTYLYIDILAPQKMGWSLMQLFPVSFIAFILAFVGWAFFDRKSGTRINIRQVISLPCCYGASSRCNGRNLRILAWGNGIGSGARSSLRSFCPLP